IAIQGRSDSKQTAHLDYVSPNYFETVGMSIDRGRGFTNRDAAGPAQVAIINEAMANTLFPEGGAIGRRFGIGTEEHGGDLEIIGVVKDAKYDDLRESGQAR